MSQAADALPNQAQVTAIEQVLVDVHNSCEEYTFASVATQCRLLHRELLANLSDVDLRGSVWAIWETQLRHLERGRSH